MSDDFDLWQLVNKVAEDPSLETPQQIARETIKHIPVQALRTALEVTLTGYVRGYLSQTRSGRPTMRELRSGVVNSGRSAKVAAIRDTYKRALDGRYHVAPGKWKRLRECTKIDVLAIAEERLRMAENNRKSAMKFKLIAKLMEQFEVERVEQIPEERLESVLIPGYERTIFEEDAGE